MMMKKIFYASAIFASCSILNATEDISNRESFISTHIIGYAGTAGHDYPLINMFGMCASAIEWNNRTFIVNDKYVRVNPHWVRDHALVMKSMRYTNPELRSFIDLLLENQTEEGFFYEIIAPISDYHSGQIVPERCRKIIPNSDYGLCRLELEADIEYLIVESVWTIWQATGDTEWLKKNLPRLEKGINYIMSSPIRWDKELGLAKRPYTIDTWDFTDRFSTSMDRGIQANDKMGIMHGDNTGLYQAQVLLSKMFDIAGDKISSARWHKESEALKERINKHLWNGEFYKHYVQIDKVDYGVDMERQLSLSNAYDINRGTASPEMVRSVLNTYRNMQKKYGGLYDDFRTLDPAFPLFFGMKAGTYTNGAVGFFIAGQLSVAAFENGMEDYGLDILLRTGRKISRDGKISFLYDYNGDDRAGGPRCWVGAELMNALTRGLAGVVDNGALFNDITLSPRFVIAEEPKAKVFLKYAASGAFVDYDFKHDKKLKQISFALNSKHDKVKLRMLLPSGTMKASAKNLEGKLLDSKIEDVFGSKYLTLENYPSESSVIISYDDGKAIEAEPKKEGVEVLSTITISPRNNAIVYMINNLPNPQKCVLDLELSGYKTVEKRAFTLQPYDKKHMEIFSLEKTDTKLPTEKIIMWLGDKKSEHTIEKTIPHWDKNFNLPK